VTPEEISGASVLEKEHTVRRPISGPVAISAFAETSRILNIDTTPGVATIFGIRILAGIGSMIGGIVMAGSAATPRLR
jgi:hypothetical protein